MMQLEFAFVQDELFYIVRAGTITIEDLFHASQLVKNAEIQNCWIPFDPTLAKELEEWHATT